ncbi:MAG: CoA transferase subunit A [Acidobacteria bacterium]|nr:CoA transferase subunit A [Acidobacteriota bacterium]
MPKVTGLGEAVASIADGAHIGLSGFSIARCAMAFAREIIRQGIRNLTVSQCVGAMDADMLVGAGAVDRLIYGGGSLDRFGLLANVNAAIETGTLVAEEYSSLSVAFRYLAGSLGLPFIPIRSLSGSDLLARLREKSGSDVATVEDPFTKVRWLVLKPLVPDVAVVQVQACDAEGNSWIMGPKWDNGELVKASGRAIVIAERVIPADEIRREPERSVIPGLLVSHVVELPFGAHPTSVYREYDYDSRRIEEYVEAGGSRDAFRAYLDAYVFGVKNHREYLEKIGGRDKLESLRADPVLGY